jgi:peptidoglycan/xylan/chitin deacetylase (PgdA/CDA1 family)
MSIQFKTQIINGIDLANLKANIDAFLIAGYVLKRKEINNTGTQAILFYRNNYVKTFANGKLLITLDGAVDTIYNVIYPVLLARGVTATYYCETGAVGGGGCLTWANAADMLANGIDVQSHTRTHTRLTLLTFPQIITELTNANNDLIANGIPAANHLAYPFGSYDANVIAAVSTMMQTGRTINGILYGSDTFLYVSQFRDVNKYIINSDYCDFTTYPSHMDFIKSCLDSAKINKSLVTIYDHGYSTASDYNTILDYAITYLGLDIINITQLYALLEP